MTTINEGGATKVNALVESRIIVEPRDMPRFFDEEKRAAWMEQWAKEFMEFIRDHRHQDVNAVYVDRIYQDQCSKCGREWEEMVDDDGDAACSWCGDKMEVVR